MKHNIYLYILVMAAVTYLIRMLPLTLIQKEIKNTYIKSFLYYVPYVTLAGMTVPAIIKATQSPAAGAVALVVGIAAAWFGASLFQVACLLYTSCEDRCLENYESLRNITTYQGLKTMFETADRKYDSGLFELLDEDRLIAVSYTHLDVYKRQSPSRSASARSSAKSSSACLRKRPKKSAR